MRLLPTLLLLLGLPAPACADPPPPDGFVLVGATLVGEGLRDVVVRGDAILAVRDPGDTAEAPSTRTDLRGRFLVPAFIDAHVHLAYLPKADELAAGGVAGGVDWAAPLAAVGESSLQVRWAGPILTAPGGYPTQGWGRDGYGLEIDGPAAARAAVAQVQSAGATVVKIAVGAGGPELSEETLTALCDEAHVRGMLVGAHALRDADALRAARVGADVLVHAPVGTLSAATLKAWAGRAVIPTLSAFGGLTSTRQLRDAGAQVLYGTDFGNTQALGVSPAEIEGLMEAGLDGAAILAAGTRDPAARFGFPSLGAIAPGKEASLLVLDADPLTDPTTLGRPVGVLWRGRFLVGPD